MSDLVGIHHVGLRVTDLDEATERWSRQFGFTVRERDADRVYLRCAFEDYSLELIQGDAPGFDHAGWELRPGTKLAEVGLDGLELDRPGGRSSSLHLKDPDGHGVEIVEWTPRASELPDFPASPRSCLAIARGSSATSTSSARTCRDCRLST